MLFFFTFLVFPFQSEAAGWGCSSDEPVCGTDGKTYKDICELNAAKTSDADLQVLYEGKCVENKMLQGPIKLSFQNNRPKLKPEIDQSTKHNLKKYLFHFRTLTKANAIAMLDNCPRKCKNMCPQNKEFGSTLYFTKSCLDCCYDII